MTCAACGSPCVERYCNKLCAYHALPFRAWDGEGITIKDAERPHRFTLLATNDKHIHNGDGIPTVDALRFLIAERPKALNIWYYFDYDVNCILRDVPLRATRERSGSLEELAKTSYTLWHGYHIHYIPNKIFHVTRGRTFESYDLSGYFQKSFVKACQSFGLDTSLIERGKEERKNFHAWPLADIIAYNQSELDLLTELATQLRKRLVYHAPKRLWYGPGAVAAQYMKRKKLDNAPDWTNEMKDAILRAYFGGRIDSRVIGEVTPCYAYDIVSAYPYAITHIPQTTGWVYAEHKRTPLHPFGLYHIAWDVETEIEWGPFPWRSREGHILYPLRGEGWYYGIEASAAQRLYRKGINILEGWEPQTTGEYPLRKSVHDIFETRKKAQRAGDPSELGYKLILNSMYGKFAQKTSQGRFARQSDEIKRPPFQNYVWAGFTTAFTRAMLLDAIRQDPANVICTATDSVFCKRPVLGTSPGGEELGTWKYEGKAPTLIVMPGVYARISDDGTADKYKQRGFPMALNYGYLLRKWGCTTKLNTDGVELDEITFSAFYTFRQAVAQGRKHWGYFSEETKGFYDVAMLGFSKRFPDPMTIIDRSWKQREMMASPLPRNESLSHLYKVPTFEEEAKYEESELL
jgi:hypothetical protein